MTSDGRPGFAWMFPVSAGVSTALWAGVSAAVGLACVFLGTMVFKEYGLALFIGVPLLMGVIVPLGHGMGAPRGFGEMLAVAVVSQIILFGFILVLGLEGLGCMVMCSPLWLLVSLGGTGVAHAIHVLMWRGYVRVGGRGFPVMGLVVVLTVPMWMGAEHAGAPEAEMIAVKTVVEIDAPPEAVWARVIAFPALPPPREWVFALGVAYPEHAVIEGHGVGAVRRCVFSTGAFVEPITVWEEGKKLAFDVIESPPSMRERSLYDIHPAHTEGYLMSRHGQFELIDLGNGRTRLEGTTWYQNRMFPAAYWRLWSDMILHRIHLRVLNHVKALSEQDVRRRG